MGYKHRCYIINYCLFLILYEIETVVKEIEQLVRFYVWK